MVFKKNDNIKKYTIMFPHKESDYAETYRVKDINGRNLFLKLINYSKLHRFQIDDASEIIEIKVSKILKHHNLPSFVDSGNIVVNGGQRAFLVTEFISGETLSQKVIRGEELSVYDIKKIAKAVLSALDYMHNLPTPIVHGEVTLQNVMLNLVGDYNDLKLIDMGNARFVNQTPIKLDLNQINPFYFAPERFSGVNQVQSDLYSVGVMLYQLLFEELPWYIDTSRAKGDKIDYILEEKKKPLKIPTRDIFELDEQLLNCIIKALSYDVDDRFQSANEFIQAIDGKVVVEVKKDNKQIERKESSNTEYTFSKTIKGPGFSAIAGMEELKQQMYDEVIDVLNNPEEYKKYGLTISNGILLYGPPGCGKTFFAKHFAEEVGLNFMHITSSSLRSKWINATQENIAKMFKEAEELAPTIIFIDEIDDLLKDRSLADDKGMSGINEFLAQMDRTGEKGIFVIGATNKPDVLDPAILRAGRLEKKFYVGVPDKPAREALFKLYLEKRPYDFGIDYSELAELTQNYVSADIRLIIENASRIALKNRSKISMEHLCSAIENYIPSLNEEQIQYYENIKMLMNGEKPKQELNKRQRIGFK